MKKSFFVFDGISSLRYGILLDAPPPLIMPERRAIKTTVQGRAGELIIPEGEDAFAPYIVGVLCRLPMSETESVRRWLAGKSGYVTFSSDETKKQRAHVLASTQFEKIGTLKWAEGTIQFLCQPFKQRVNDVTQTIIDSAEKTVMNLGDAKENPRITLSGSGDITITVNDNAFTIAGITAEMGGAIVDSDAGIVTALETGEIITQLTEGEFPVFAQGRNTISITGAGSATLARRERFL